MWNPMNLLQTTQTVFVATCDGDLPKVRPMTMIFHEGRLWFATGATGRKSAEIARNPHSEIILMTKDEENGYLRIAGNMVSIADTEMKRRVSDVSGFIKDYFEDPADPNYMLYNLIPVSVRILKPGEMYETDWSLPG